MLTVEDLASLLKVPKSWIYEHTGAKCRDPIPSIRLGKYRRFFAADVQRFLETRRQTAREDR